MVGDLRPWAFELRWQPGRPPDWVAMSTASAILANRMSTMPVQQAARSRDRGARRSPRASRRATTTTAWHTSDIQGASCGPQGVV